MSIVGVRTSAVKLKEAWSGSPDVFWVDPSSLELKYCRTADYDAVHMANEDCLLF